MAYKRRYDDDRDSVIAARRSRKNTEVVRDHTGSSMLAIALQPPALAPRGQIERHDGHRWAAHVARAENRLQEFDSAS